MAVSFDPRSLEITSDAVPVIEGVRRAAPSVGNAAQVDFSNTGVLAYVSGPARAGHDDVFIYDQKGEITSLKLPPGSYSYPRVSPDGQRIALETHDGKNSVVSIYDLSPRDDVFLFSATKGTESTLWTFSLRDRKRPLRFRVALDLRRQRLRALSTFCATDASSPSTPSACRWTSAHRRSRSS